MFRHDAFGIVRVEPSIEAKGSSDFPSSMARIGSTSARLSGDGPKRRRTALMTRRTQWNWNRAIQDERTPKSAAYNTASVMQLSAAFGMYDSDMKTPSRAARRHPSLAIDAVCASNDRDMNGTA